jgi:hypothetical protein
VLDGDVGLGLADDVLGLSDNLSSMLLNLFFSGTDDKAKYTRVSTPDKFLRQV